MQYTPETQYSVAQEQEEKIIGMQVALRMMFDALAKQDPNIVPPILKQLSDQFRSRDGLSDEQIARMQRIETAAYAALGITRGVAS